MDVPDWAAEWTVREVLENLPLGGISESSTGPTYQMVRKEFDRLLHNPIGNDETLDSVWDFLDIEVQSLIYDSYLRMYPNAP